MVAAGVNDDMSITGAGGDVMTYVRPASCAPSGLAAKGAGAGRCEPPER